MDGVLPASRLNGANTQSQSLPCLFVRVRKCYTKDSLRFFELLLTILQARNESYQHSNSNLAGHSFGKKKNLLATQILSHTIHPTLRHYGHSTRVLAYLLSVTPLSQELYLGETLSNRPKIDPPTWDRCS